MANPGICLYTLISLFRCAPIRVFGSPMWLPANLKLPSAGDEVETLGDRSTTTVGRGLGSGFALRRRSIQPLEGAYVLGSPFVEDLVPRCLLPEGLWTLVGEDSFPWFALRRWYRV